MRKIQVFSIGTEGGSITVYKLYIENHGRYFYYHNVSEMAYEDLDIEATNRDSELSSSFIDAFQMLQIEFPYIWGLYPTHVAEEIREIVLYNLKQYLRSDAEKGFNYERWSEVLLVKTEDLKNLVKN